MVSGERKSEMKTVKLNFNLPDEGDDWPPVTTECMPFEDQGGGAYRLLVPPLFVRDLSVDDVLLVEIGKEGIVENWRHKARSNRSTIWVLGLKQKNFEIVVKKLLELRCNVTRALSFDVASIDVPGELDRKTLESWLDKLDEDAVGYPSYRHED